jgi:PAS domain S-box-containing protein
MKKRRVRSSQQPPPPASIEAVLGRHQDESERSQIERALRQSEEGFRALANAVPAIVWTAAPDGTITYANDQWFHYCGLTPEENARSWPELVLHPDDRERCIREWTRALQLGTTYEIEVRNRRYDGEYRWFLTRAAPMRDAEGHIIAWFGTTTDIQDRKVAEEERATLLKREQSARKEAEAAVRLRDTFLSVAAHELKTPLTTLLGNAQLLQRRAARDAIMTRATRRAVDVIASQAGRLNKMIAALLDASRIETGQLSIERERLDLCALAQRVVGEIRPSLERHTIVCDAPDEAVIVEGDELRLEQVLQNLIQNAIKYSPNGGTVTVRVERRGDSAAVSVSDQGIGIPAQALPKLFRRFYRASNVEDQHISGMGIGLYVVKEIVALHGGDVEAESVEGQGSTFRISLPRADN